jgi:hypothetical protein
LDIGEQQLLDFFPRQILAPYQRCSGIDSSLQTLAARLQPIARVLS